MGIKKVFLGVLIFFFVTSCQDISQKQKLSNGNLTTDSSLSLPEIVLIDRFDNQLFLDTLINRIVAQFTPIYIGPLKDSIRVTYKISNIPQQLEYSPYRIPNENDISIFIDTSKTIGFPMPIGEYYKTPEYRIKKKSYPIFIKNLSLDTLKIGYGELLPMVTEAQDSLGNWIELEKPIVLYCGTKKNDIFLPPNQYAITTLRQNFGITPTVFRVKYETKDSVVFSNKIFGNL
ncbi:hypothetical protein [Crocinitomix algicola]|uniref:hypothetical protein n=1 Tax=Crocinitomix algicola TaxID=1740263 RepID=UPI0008721C78|nr:hypothetical protein [Crocinitomix algicola]